jgi:hypothetical protein
MALTQVQPGMLTGNNPAIPTSVGVGTEALNSNSGLNNTAVGYQALKSITTATLNTAFGYQAGVSATASYNTMFGAGAGSGASFTGNENTLIGYYAGNALTSGSKNTFVGPAFGNGSGGLITTGGSNTVIGGYSGNTGGLDIRTASNNIVLSDGDGNPYLYFGSTGQSTFRTVGVDNLITMTSSAGAYSSRIQMGSAGGGAAVLASTQNQLSCQTGGTGGVFLSSGGTSWQAASDERVKENLQEITDAANKVASLRAVTGNYIWDESKKSRAFLIAQDVLKVLPEAVETKNPDEYGLAYSDVIPLLVAAIKEQQAIITDLTTRLEALEAK